MAYISKALFAFILAIIIILFLNQIGPFFATEFVVIAAIFFDDSAFYNDMVFSNVEEKEKKEE